MASIARAARLAVFASSAALALALAAGPARAQLNNGPGIGPSEALERPDLQQQEAKAVGRGAPKHRPAHSRQTTPKARRATPPN